MHIETPTSSSKSLVFIQTFLALPISGLPASRDVSIERASSRCPPPGEKDVYAKAQADQEMISGAIDEFGSARTPQCRRREVGTGSG